MTSRVLAERMPHLMLGMAVFVLASWWVLARGGEQQGRQPPPAQQDTSAAASSCDACGACDCACEAGDLCSACEGCDIGGCDCVAVPPGALTQPFEAADRGLHGQVRPRHDRRAGLQQWASLGLLVPLAVMFWWRRRK